jgi:hypothetical protein
MANFEIIFKIENADDTEALATLQWLHTNYGVDIPNAIFRSNSKQVTGAITKETFALAVPVQQALISEFGERLTKYDLQISG